LRAFRQHVENAAPAAEVESAAGATRDDGARVDGGRMDGGRLARLEAEVAELRGEIAALQAQFAEFRKQLE
jgi:molecular chaperone GrpE (heat shock protein)